LTRQIAPSIGFPESHDTERLFSESGRNVEALKQCYLFVALFSSGVMVPIGYEYGFRNRLHVVDTRPEHWEEQAVDLTDFITRVNRIKSDYPVFQEEGPIQKLDHPNPPCPYSGRHPPAVTARRCWRSTKTLGTASTSTATTSTGTCRQRHHSKIFLRNGRWNTCPHPSISSWVRGWGG